MKLHVVKIRGERRWYEGGQLNEPCFTSLRSAAFVFKSHNAARNAAIDIEGCDVIEVDGEADR